MESVQLFLDQFRPHSEAESLWLKDIFSFITEQVCPLCPTPPAAGGGLWPDQSVSLSVSLVKKIQEIASVSHTLPVSYRLVSVSELLSRQHLACVSHLSWTTNQQRAWAKEAELSMPGIKALPRVNLLLIGCLRAGQGGDWRLTDSSDSVRCEVLSPSSLWLNQPVFLPHWNYIPHNASGQEEPTGWVELIGSPILLSPGPEQGLTGGVRGQSRVVGVREAAAMLRHRIRGQRVSVRGQVGSVSPVLVVAGTTFFCFTLTDDTHTVPVLVKDVSRLWWSQCVCVDQSVCVTVLRVCVLRGWKGNNILSVTDQSEIHTDYTPVDNTPVDNTPVDNTPEIDTPEIDTPENDKHTEDCTHAESQLDTSPLMMSHECEEVELDGHVAQSGVRPKQSRVISYQGTVTHVVSEGAGLYVIDKKVGLCLAYQPSPRRSLRAGDSVELHQVHFLYRPCPDFPPSVLCTCLRSSIRVTSFSRVGGASPDSSCPGDGVLPRLLLEKNMGVSEYLWVCHLSSQLAHSVLKEHCVCVLSWKIMELVWRRGRGGGRARRDIYSEMLDETHTCPLTQYSVDSEVHKYISLSKLTRSLQSDCWSSLSLSSLLPPGGTSLSKSEINTGLSWSCRILRSDCQIGDSLRQRPLLVVGVLELPSQTSEHKHNLQLRDGTGAMSCVVTETSEDAEGGQVASFNTAWIGCLVCVHQFTMVTERFLQSDFPSYQHLDQERFITHRCCRVYLQFSLDHVHVLSPSAAMVTHLKHTSETVEGEKEGGQDTGRKRRRTESSATAATQSCISMVIRVDQREGVAWTNTGVGLNEQEAGLSLCFSVRAAVIGPVVSWDRDPKNGPMTDRETEKGRQEQVVLVFSGVSSRWFPVLQPGCFYRVIAANTQDHSIFIGCGVSVRSGVELHTDSTVQVKSDWRFHTLTWPLHVSTQTVSPSVLSVSDVLDSSSELVSFQGLVSDRISLNDRTRHTRTNTGVRLTMCDQTGRSLQVYLDLSHNPYPPGMLPGNKLLLSGFQRKISRSGNVYCSYLPVSSVTVISLGDSSCAQPPPAPIMHLSDWAVSREQKSSVGRVRGHVVCFLFLQLQWSCSLCGALFTQSCSSSLCGSTSSVFQAKAKLVIDDGTGEAHVWFSGDLLRPLLGLADSQWEGLQRALRVKGHIRVYHRGRSLVSDGDSDDALFLFLLCAFSSDVVSRPISLTCRRLSSHRTEDLRRFSRGDRDFMTRMVPPLQLTCLTISVQ